MRNLWELAALIDNIASELDRAACMAVECSGYVAPIPFGDCPDPGEPGWEEMLRLSDELGRRAESMKKILDDFPEVREGIEAEARDLDDLSDRADAASY